MCYNNIYRRIMIGVLVNVASIAVGATIGVILKRFLSEKITSAVMTALGLATFLIGVKGALKVEKELLFSISLALGTVIGTIIDIDKYVNQFGEFLKNAFVKNANDKSFAEAFANASILFAVGAMSVIGSINAGLKHDYNILYLKSTLDFMAAVMFGASMGIGVAFSALTILVFEGAIAILAGGLTFLAEDAALMNEFSAVGNLLVAVIGLNLIGVTKIKLANMLPAIVVVVILYRIII